MTHMAGLAFVTHIVFLSGSTAFEGQQRLCHLYHDPGAAQAAGMPRLCCSPEGPWPWLLGTPSMAHLDLQGC